MKRKDGNVSEGGRDTEAGPNFFRSQRERIGKTQFEVAVLMGLTPGAVSSWETGRCIPELSIADRIASVYGVSLGRVEREIVALHRKNRLVTSAA